MWSPLRRPAFRGLWISGGIYFLGNAMHTMAVSWLMVQTTGSSFLAALVQTAAFLPMFLLSLPAGVLADIADIAGGEGRERARQLSSAGRQARSALLQELADRRGRVDDPLRNRHLVSPHVLPGVDTHRFRGQLFQFLYK